MDGDNDPSVASLPIHIILPTLYPALSFAFLFLTHLRPYLIFYSFLGQQSSTPFLLFYAHLDYHDTFYRLLHFEIIIISTALSPSLYHLSCLYYIHPSYNSPFIILFPFRYTGAQYFLRSSLPSYAHPTLLCFSTLQRLPSSHPFLITHLIRFIHCDTTTSPPVPIPPPLPFYTH